MLKNFKKWTDLPNRWQRLWIILSVAGLIHGIFIHPFSTNTTNQLNEIQSEASNPECINYVKENFFKLKKAGLDSPCFWIYIYREKFPSDAEFHYEKYEKEFKETRHKNLISDAIFGGAFYLTISIIIYIAGILMAWILDGFCKNNK